MINQIHEHKLNVGSRPMRGGRIIGLLLSCGLRPGAGAKDAPDSEVLAGQPADIASSAYQYRAGRTADQNAPESWFALLRYAGQPLNAPADINSPAIKRVLRALLWGEIRPIRELQLIWDAHAKRRPAPGDVVITTLNHQGTASSWWNNLAAVTHAGKPVVSDDNTAFVYPIRTDTCGIVVSVAGDNTASDYDVPAVRVLTADTWKTIDVEIEIVVTNAPTHFGTVGYEIVSDVDNGKISATLEMPSRNPPRSVLLRLRHPKASPIREVIVNGESWKDFDRNRELLVLKGLDGKTTVHVNY